MPLEVSKDVGWQWAVEIVWNGERACGKPERPGRRRRRGEGPDFRDRAASADDDNVLPGLDSGEESRSVMGEFLRADGAHGRSLPLRAVAGKGRAKVSIPSGIQMWAPGARRSGRRKRVPCGCSCGLPPSPSRQTDRSASPLHLICGRLRRVARRVRVPYRAAFPPLSIPGVGGNTPNVSLE